MARIKISDNDFGEIAAMCDGEVLRSSVYRDRVEQRAKMLAAREFAEGWHQATKRKEER